MRIDSRFGPVSTVGPGQARAPSRGGFAVRDGSEGRAATVSSTGATSTLDAILALQGGEDPTERRRRGARAGVAALNALDALKSALLGGTVSAAALSAIESRLAALGPTGDPGLDEVLASIDLRARVELAKLGRSV